MFIWAQLDMGIVGIIGMLIAIVVLKLGVRAAKNPESGLYKVYSVSLAIIRYPLWIFTAFIGIALLAIAITSGAGEFFLGGVLLGSFLLFVGLAGIRNAFKSKKSERDE